MFILTFIRKLYKVLSSDSSPAGIAFAIAFGILAGSVPVLSGLTLFLLLLTFVFRVQIASALLAWGLMRLACHAGLALYFESLGQKLLDAPALEGFWKFVLNLKVVAWFGLNSYAMLGGALLGLALGIALFVPVRLSVIAYRKFAHEKVSQNKFFRWLTNFWVIKVLRFVLVGSQA